MKRPKKKIPWPYTVKLRLTKRTLKLVKTIAKEENTDIDGAICLMCDLALDYEREQCQDKI